MFHTHIYTYIHFHMYSIEPSRAVECLFSFLGWYQLQLGLLGLYIQHSTAGNRKERKRQKVKIKENDKKLKKLKIKMIFATHFTSITWHIWEWYAASTHLFYCLATPPPRMATDWLWKSPAPERLTLGWVGEATGGWPGLIGLAVKRGNMTS